MKRLLLLLALVAICSVPTFAQVTPIFEVNGGYTFQRWDVPSFAQPPSSLNFNGFNAGASFFFTRWLAGAVDVTGTFNTQSDPINGTAKTHIYSYLFGPRIYPLGHHKLTPYFHGMFGVATYDINVPAFGGNPAFSESNDDFSYAIGGGLDLSLGKHIAIRLGQFDYQQTRFLHADAVTAGVSPENQNNFKYSAGIVFKFGQR
jgi:opacity protein-like surface antigen